MGFALGRSGRLVGLLLLRIGRPMTVRINNITVMIGTMFSSTRDTKTIPRDLITTVQSLGIPLLER